MVLSCPGGCWPHRGSDADQRGRVMSPGEQRRQLESLCMESVQCKHSLSSEMSHPPFCRAAICKACSFERRACWKPASNRLYVFDGMPPAAKKEELARRWAALDGASRAQLLPWSGLMTLCARELCLVSCEPVNNLHSCLQSCACAGLSGEERQQRTWQRQRRCRRLELHTASACIRCEHGCGTMEPGTQQCCQFCNLCLTCMQTKTAEEIEKYSKRTVRVTKQHNDECKRLLVLLGCAHH